MNKSYYSQLGTQVLFCSQPGQLGVMKEKYCQKKPAFLLLIKSIGEDGGGWQLRGVLTLLLNCADFLQYASLCNDFMRYAVWKAMKDRVELLWWITDIRSPFLTPTHILLMSATVTRRTVLLIHICWHLGQRLWPRTGIIVRYTCFWFAKIAPILPRNMYE